MKKGMRIIAKVYESVQAYNNAPHIIWGYRFFDETGKRKVFDASVKELLNAKNKDLFNALSVTCYHAHLCKRDNNLKISFEDGDLANLPCITRDNTLLGVGYPMIYEVIREGTQLSGFNVVSPLGQSQRMTVDGLKAYVLDNLKGRALIAQGGTIQAFNYQIGSRCVGGKMQIVLRHNSQYALPVLKE